MAIALSGGVPDYGADGIAGQPRVGIFKRQRDSLTPERAQLAQDHHERRVRPADGTAALLAGPAERITAAQNETGQSEQPADIDVRLVKESFAHLMTNAALAMEHFYSHLFTVSPEMRSMFPMGMGQMREHVFAALARLVWTMDSPVESATYLAQLGRDHRKYGVKEKHYGAFFAALLDTAEYFGGSDWTPETAAAWRGTLDHAARIMRSAAQQDARHHPPWWLGEIVAHDRRTESIAVLTIAPDRPLPYRPGQYVPVQVTRWPRVWRPYSIANAPRADGLIDLHVRAVPGGMVSTSLVRHVSVGDTVILGPASGKMTVPDNDRDVLCIAGGTGLGPVKALIEEVAGRQQAGRARDVTLFVGAREQQDLYDLPALRALQAGYPGLRVITVLSERPEPDGEQGLRPDPGLHEDPGLLPDVIRAYGLFEGCEAVVCGPEAMVRNTTLMLAGHIAPGQVHHDPLPDAQFPGSRPFAPAPPPDAGQPDEFHSHLFAKFARPGFPPDALP